MAKLPVADFLTKRLKEYDPTFEVRKGTGFSQLFFNPMQFIIQPLIDEAIELGVAQSFLRILQQDNPDAFSEEKVDSLVSNFFVTRDPGGVSSGVARVYYAQPLNREWPAAGTVFTGSNGKSYSNPGAYSITRDGMSLNIEDGMYYYDITVRSDDLGSDTELAAEGLVSLDNDPDALSVVNKAPIAGGRAKETNTQVITRTRRSIAVRDLVTGKGFNATMFENFVGSLTEIQPIGYGEQEMMRDIVYNTHIGGKIDGYFKTATITSSYKNFVGIMPDYTRQAYGSTNMQIYLTLPAAVPDGNFDVANGKIPIVQQVKTSKAAEYTTTADLSSPVDMTTGNRIKLTVDGLSKEFSLTGSNPTTTTQAEIINHINGSFGYIVATPISSFIKLLSRVKGKGSSIFIQNPESKSSRIIQDIRYIAVSSGPDALAITIAYVGGGTVDEEVATVIGSAITVEIEDGVSTAAKIKAAIESNPYALDLVSVLISGSGTNVQVASTPLGLIGGSALTKIFGLTVPTEFAGDGPIVFTQDLHYTVDTAYGTISRVLGSAVVSDGSDPVTTGVAEAGSSTFTDPTYEIFADVAVNDILTVNPWGSDQQDDPLADPSTWRKDYRVLSVSDDSTLILDEELNYDKTGVVYWIQRTGIKHGENVYIQYWFNPLSIDIGPLVKLDYLGDAYSGTRGIRPDREEMTITEVAFLRINKIEIVDPITYEPTGEILATGGGYGEGGYGEGPYGIGSGSDYYMVVNSPTERFSAFEDSFIVLHPSLVGLSIRIDYDCAPECLSMHNFVRSENERVLDGDILMKHFLPAYVSGTIVYRVDSTDSTILSNDDLTAALKEFINIQPAGSNLEISEVYQFLARSTDPYDRYGTYIQPFKLTAMIHNTDGSTTVVSSGDRLVVPTLKPFPRDTARPLSPKITHWVADNLVLERIT